MKDVAQQLRRDWFGKDVQATPTVSYVWTADQFGHFGLGFQITFLITWILPFVIFGIEPNDLALIAAGINLGIWILKEILDYLRERRQKSSIFPFNSGELLFNVLTALFYIACGAIIAGTAGFMGAKGALIGLLVLLGPATILLIWWVRRKMTFQQAGLPFLYRLANLRSKILGDGETLRAATIALSTPSRDDLAQPLVRHLLVTGPLGSGKTCLACGIGTEYTFRLGIARYTTLVKLFEAAAPKQTRQQVIMQSGGSVLEEQDGRILWPWRDVDLLIVDDVDAMLEETRLPLDTTQSDEQASVQRRNQVLVQRQKDVATWREIVLRQLEAINIQTFKDRRTVWVVSDVAEVRAWFDTIAHALGCSQDECETTIEIIRLERDENAFAD